jgi:hypothetical protein
VPAIILLTVICGLDPGIIRDGRVKPGHGD